MVGETVDNQSEEILGIALLAKEPKILTVSLVVLIVLGPLRYLLTLDENTTGLAVLRRMVGVIIST